MQSGSPPQLAKVFVPVKAVYIFTGVENLNMQDASRAGLSSPCPHWMN